MTLTKLIADYNEVNKLIINKERKGKTFDESVKELISEEFVRVGVNLKDIPKMSYLEYRKELEKSDLLKFLHGIAMGVSADNKFVIVKYNPNYIGFYANYKYARSLVLTREVDNVKVVSYGFTKFFNLGEHDITTQDLDKKIAEKGKGYIAKKLDGVNITMRSIEDNIVINTVGSVSNSEKIDSNKNPIFQAEKMINTTDKNIKKMLIENEYISFIFEYIGFQDIVVEYDKSEYGLYLIGGRRFSDVSGLKSQMLNQEELNDFAKKYGIKRIYSEEVTNIDEVMEYVNGEEMRGQEGVVLYIGEELYKIKREDYVMAHTLKRYRKVKDEKGILGFTTLLVNLIVYDSLDDYIGIFKGTVPNFVKKGIEIVTTKHKELNINVVDYIKRNDVEINKFINEIPNNQKEMALDVYNDTDYRPNMCKVLIEDTVDILKKLPKEDFDVNVVRQVKGKVTTDILQKHMQKLYGKDRYASTEFISRGRRLLYLYNHQMKQLKNVTLSEGILDTKNNTSKYPIITVRFGENFSLIFTPSSAYSFDKKRKDMFCLYTVDDDEYTLKDFEKVVKKYKNMPYLIDIYDGRKNILKWNSK